MLLVAPGDRSLYAQAQTDPPKQQTATKLPPDQLDALVAPIALYPDPMLSQTLVAATYPLEIVQLQQWLTKNSGLKDQALADAVKKQNWDPSIQAMAGLPDVVKQLSENIKWTTDLGNAFLAQQDEVMEAVQRMRKKAKDNGNLKTTEQQKVEVKTVESKTVIVVEQASPQVVYVPSYNPTVVYGPPVYPYPPITYPPPGYYAAGMAISFGVGVAMGAFWSGGWGYHCGWHGGGNTVVINNNNNFVNHHNSNINRNTNRNTNRNVGNTNWQHNPEHRGGAPYADRSTADRFGGTTRGDSLSNRQAAARQNIERSNRPQTGSLERGGGRGAGGGAAAPSTRDMGRGGGDRIGSRQVSNSPSTSDRSAFSSGGMRGSDARASSQRGSSSTRSSRGFSGGGGGRGGGRRR